MVQPSHSLFRLAGSWNGIHPRLAVTIFRAERDVNLHDVCSRVLIFFRCEPGQAV
jgi:hypothetical protein